MGLFVEGEKADEALGFLITQIEKQSGKNLKNPSLRQLNCVIANLYKLLKRNPRLWTRLKLRNTKVRYNPLGVSPETLRNLINYLCQLEYIHFVRGNNVREDKTYDSHSPRIVADDKLIELLEGQFNWDTSLLRYDETDEVIIMINAEGKRVLTTPILMCATRGICLNATISFCYGRKSNNLMTGGRSSTLSGQDAALTMMTGLQVAVYGAVSTSKSLE